MSTKKLILSRLLPKTGQSVSYGQEDDGELEKGWWKGKTVANNKTRFISKTISGDDVVVDRATNLMWAADGDGGGCGDGGLDSWVGSLANARLLIFAGFSDWRIPNIIELFSLLDHSLNPVKIYAAFFPNTKGTAYWSSTSSGIVFDSARCVSFANGDVNNQLKTDNFYMRCVRSL